MQKADVTKPTATDNNLVVLKSSQISTFLLSISHYMSDADRSRLKHICSVRGMTVKQG